MGHSKIAMNQAVGRLYVQEGTASKPPEKQRSPGNRAPGISRDRR
jgi:hypothetical protein